MSLRDKGAHEGGAMTYKKNRHSAKWWCYQPIFSSVSHPLSFQFSRLFLVPPLHAVQLISNKVYALRPYTPRHLRLLIATAMSVRRGSAVQTNGLVTPTPYVSLAEVRENKPDTPVVTRFGLSINVRRGNV